MFQKRSHINLFIVTKHCQKKFLCRGSSFVLFFFWFWRSAMSCIFLLGRNDELNYHRSKYRKESRFLRHGSAVKVLCNSCHDTACVRLSVCAVTIVYRFFTAIQLLDSVDMPNWIAMRCWVIRRSTSFRSFLSVTETHRLLWDASSVFALPASHLRNFNAQLVTVLLSAVSLLLLKVRSQFDVLTVLVYCYWKKSVHAGLWRRILAYMCCHAQLGSTFCLRVAR